MFNLRKFMFIQIDKITNLARFQSEIGLFFDDFCVEIWWFKIYCVTLYVQMQFI